MYILNSIAHERAERKKPDLDFDPFEALLAEMKEVGLHKDLQTIVDFYQEISTLEYSHPGLTGAEYMQHPVRVARLALCYCEDASVDLLRLCLSHNILEVVDFSNYELTGSLLSHKEHLLCLLVDRSKEWDVRYKELYYSKVENSRITSAVKVIDKLDNLYVLDSNPDDQVKRRYLGEINQFVIPLAEKYVQKLLPDLKSITKYQEELIK